MIQEEPRLVRGFFWPKCVAGSILMTYSHPMPKQARSTSKFPDWASAMQPGLWYRISGDTPDLGLPPTAHRHSLPGG